MNFKKIALIVAGVLALIVLLQNSEVVTVKFLFWHFAMSQIILLPLTVLAGFAAGFVVGKKRI